MDDDRLSGRDFEQLRHRRVIEPPLGLRPFRGSDLFDRIGGQPTVDRLVDLLYVGIEGDRELRPMFPRDLTDGREMQKVFFAEWFGGPADYSDESHSGLLHRHAGLPITPRAAGRWLGHFKHAMEESVAAGGDQQEMFAAVRSMASVLVNDGNADSRASTAWESNRRRAINGATQLARRGDRTGLERALAASPDLMRPRYVGAIVQAAALAGRVEVLGALLDRGVSPDVPFYLAVDVAGSAFERVLFVTPLCAARMRSRTAVTEQLVAAGAHDDVFTSTFLGDGADVRRRLDDEPALARAFDPAADALDVTPVEHAVAGGHIDALHALLEAGPTVTASGRALRGAAERGDPAMVELLLAHGADATRVGVGRWVMDPELAALLTRHGASIDRTGAWIGACCTGNQGRKDDPEYVRALLRHGARADDRRHAKPGRSTGVVALDATALHYAAKAGFLETIELLLDHGADPGARDARGRTPLDWLNDAAPTVAREQVRELLAARAT